MTEHAEMETRHEARFPVDPTQPFELIVHVIDSEVTIRAADRRDALVNHDAPAHRAGMVIDAQGNRIAIRPDTRAGIQDDVDVNAIAGQIARAFRRGASRPSGLQGEARSFAGNGGWGDITIEIPRAMRGRVEIHTISGDMQIEEVTGEIALESMSGSARIRATRGDLSLRTASGDLTVESASGRLTTHSASGDVRISASELEQLTLQTASGDVHIGAALAGDGPFRAHTANGDIRLALQRPAVSNAEPAAILTFSTVSGDAHISPPFRAAGRGRWQTGAGDRGPRIEAATVSGDLSAEVAATDRAVSPPPSPTPPARSVAPGGSDAPEGAWREPASVSEAPGERPGNAERLAVLEAVERGELDIEEALRLLEPADVIASP
jgi:hypothetical protein